MHGVSQGECQSAVISQSDVSRPRDRLLFGESHSVIRDQETQEIKASESNAAKSTPILSLELSPRIALLTPYTGGNFGDASIQDAFIANLRLRLPRAQFSGISLNCDNFLKRHGTQAYPLCNSNSPFYGMVCNSKSESQTQAETYPALRIKVKPSLRRALSRIPIARWLNRKLRAPFANIKQELRHWIGGYRFLRTQDLLVVSGGGQLDEEWGGAWGHPFTLMKWAVLARAARVPFVVASVGAGKMSSFACRSFLSIALRLAKYRSYRDKHSRELLGRLLPNSSGDSIVPDLAFSFPLSGLAPADDLRSLAQGKTIVAISPISYAKPETWPHQDRQLYDRYLSHIVELIRLLSSGDYFVVIVWSSYSDRQVVADLRHLFKAVQPAPEFYVPELESWKGLVGILRSVDIVIASRLHSIILSTLSQKPTIAVSFDPKVDWVMEDLNQTDYLMQIRDFTAGQLAQTIQRIQTRRYDVERKLASYQLRIQPVLAKQYDALAEFSVAGLRNRN
jgi:polysaccharide pyruvyl transferase WcaK-like protein